MMSLPSFKMYAVAQCVKSMRIVFKTYYHEYKYPQFRTSLEYQFYYYFLPKLNDILAKGFSPEIVACRGFLDDQVAKLSTGSPIEQLGKSMELDALTGQTLH